MRVMRNKFGFTLIEMLVSVAIMSTLIVCASSAYNALNQTSRNLAAELQSKFQTMDGGFNTWFQAKSTEPTSATNYLADPNFAGTSYLMVPQATIGLDTTYTNAVNGFVMFKNTAAGGGHYIAAMVKGTPATTDPIWQALVQIQASLPTGKFWYNCANASVVASCSTATPIASGIIMYWIDHN